MAPLRASRCPLLRSLSHLLDEAERPSRRLGFLLALSSSLLARFPLAPPELVNEVPSRHYFRSSVGGTSRPLLSSSPSSPNFGTTLIMRTASFALVVGLLSTLSIAAPAEVPDTVLKVGDQPEKEFFAKRDLAERATTSTYFNRATLKAGQGITRTVVYANATSTAAAVSSSKPASSSTVSKASTTTALAAAAPSSTLGSDIRSAVLNEHNTFRALHSAPALVWNQTLADKAASWANKCVFQHSQGALGRYGENLAASAGSGVTVQTALSGIKAWEAEAPDYTPENPNYSHFTQMVWKASKQLGCYQASCPAGSIFDARYGVNSFLVCEYDPPGNVYPASNFVANVTP